jgi:hypothetical protein
MTDHQLGWDDTLVYALNAHQPDYALALPGTAWDIVTAQWWFRQVYQPVQQFSEATLYGRVTPFQMPTTIDVSDTYQDGLALDALTLANTELEPGHFLTATLSISVTQSSPRPIRFTTYLVSTGDFERYAITDFDPFENLYPSQHWQAGDYLQIPFRLTIPSDLTWGAYNLGVIIHNTESGDRLVNSVGADENHLGLLRNGRPDEMLDSDLIVQSINQAWENGIILNQLALPDMPLPAGSNLPLQFQWDTTSQQNRDWTYFIHLVDEQHEIVAQLDQRPYQGRWPTTAWRPNMPFWETGVLKIPSELPPGIYSLRIGFYISDERLPLAGETADFLLLSNIITVEP